MLDFLRGRKKLILFLYILLFIYMVFVGRYPVLPLISVFSALIIIFAIINYSSILGIMGNFYYMLSNMKKAEKYLEMSIKARTGQPTVYLNRAILCLKSGDADRALTLLEKAKNINRKIMTDKNISQTLAGCFLLLGQSSEAIDVLNKLKENYGRLDSESQLILAYAHYRDGDFGTAIELSKVPGDMGANPEALEILGLSYYKLGDTNTAFKYLEESLKINNCLIESNFYMGEIYKEMGFKNNAAIYYHNALQAMPGTFGGISEKDINERIINLQK
ncbi:MAG: tetratricopeptide repeat protein [Clostridiales bacterium]|jgi:tetratricopeptide (TPR) repeat protein|nr:tetratricopeptide repeat protein [Clostridiales bacterium]